MIDNQTRQAIKELIENVIERKLARYQAETEYKPFFEAIFSKDVILQASLMQSLYTTFGMSIYEQMAKILAQSVGIECQTQFELLGEMNDDARLLIDTLCENSIGDEYSKAGEIELIRDVIKPGTANVHPDSTVDVFMRNENGVEFYIDITTVKLNKKGVRALRRKMLVWTALRLSQNPDAVIHTYIGVPYNPYFPEEYSRSFVRNYSYREEVLVQEDLWKLFAGYDVFDDLVDIFSEVGASMKEQIDTFLG
jgi:hypothetical protein